MKASGALRAKFIFYTTTAGEPGADKTLVLPPVPTKPVPVPGH